MRNHYCYVCCFVVTNGMGFVEQNWPGSIIGRVGGGGCSSLIGLK